VHKSKTSTGIKTEVESKSIDTAIHNVVFMT